MFKWIRNLRCQYSFAKAKLHICSYKTKEYIKLHNGARWHYLYWENNKDILTATCVKKCKICGKCRVESVLISQRKN